MRVLAAVFVLALGIFPFLGCGSGGGGFSCSSQCGFCSTDFDCCDSGAICVDVSDGSRRCTTFTPVFC